MRRLLVGVVGAVLVVVGVALAAGATLSAGPGFGDVVTLVALAGAAIALWKVGRSFPADGDVAIPAWAPGGAIVHGEPERTPTEHPLSGTGLSDVVATAGETARAEGTVEDGLAVLGPPLREALLDALVLGGMDRAAAEQSIREGEWTDSEWAAYVVEPSVGAPRWTLRQRFRAWLFPEDTVQRVARVAMDGVARAADDAIPSVPGQNAPRTVPVATPSIADLQRGADGELQEAIEPTAIQRGPVPPSEHHGLDERYDGDASPNDATRSPTDEAADSATDGAASGTGAGTTDDGGEEAVGR